MSECRKDDNQKYKVARKYVLNHFGLIQFLGRNTIRLLRVAKLTIV